MKTLRLLSFLVVFIAFSCKKENANRNNSIINTTPKSIIYQGLDTSTGVYGTFQTFYLYPDSNGIYFDSVSHRLVNDPTVSTDHYNYTMFNSKKYLTLNTSPLIDSTNRPVIKFDNNNRITAIYDRYNLLTDAPTNLDDITNNEISYNNFGTSTTFISHFATLNAFGSTSDFSYNFDVVKANNDSMNIVSGKNHDQIIYDRIFKYTVLFDTKLNNSNIILLSGYLYQPFGNLNSQSSIMYRFKINLIPFPKLSLPLAKSIYITEDQGVSKRLKLKDFSYEFDENNRVTKAIIQNYYSTALGILIPERYTSRILFTY